MGVPSVWPSKTPERILTVSVSLRWVTRALWPGTRRSRSGWMSASDRDRRGGQPSTMAPMAAPCDSPHVVRRKSWPQVLPTAREYPARGPSAVTSNGVDGRAPPRTDVVRGLPLLDHGARGHARAGRAAGRRPHGLPRWPGLALAAAAHPPGADRDAGGAAAHRLHQWV